MSRFITAQVQNTSPNYIYTNLTARISIVNSQNQVVTVEDIAIPILVQNQLSEFKFYWNTSLNPPANYSVDLDIFSGDQLLSSKVAAFNISLSSVLTGTISISPAVVILGNTTQASYTIQNNGNTALTGLPVSILIVDPDTQTSTTVYNDTIDLGMQSVKSGTINLPTTGDALKTYIVVLQYLSQGSPMNITSTNFTVTQPPTPPVTTITGKPNNPSNGSSASFAFTSTEVSTFQCQLDGGSFAACTSSVSYAGLPDGTHTFAVKATNAAGNPEVTPASYTWLIDTVPPKSVISSPLNGATLMGATFNITGSASDQGTQIQKVEISTDGGTTWQTAQETSSWNFNWTVATEGSYTFRSRATDSAGNVEIPGAGITVYVYKRQPTPVSIGAGQLLVSGNPFTIKGVVYSPVPIGDDPGTMAPYGDYMTINYNVIYNRDLPLLRQMGANTLRLLSWDDIADHHDFLDNAYNGGVQPIYVIAGYWINPGQNIDPQSPNNVRQQLKTSFRAMVAAYKNHPAILMWALGNDLNDVSNYGGNLNNLFSLINEMAAEAHAEEGGAYHPVTVALTDKNLASTIAAYDATLPSLDVWGANVYRGNTFGTLFSDFKAASAKPLVILEYGIDAFDNVNGDEYENTGVAYQDIYAWALWKEIKANPGVCVGGSIMEYSDEWWKGKYSTDQVCPDLNPAVHSTCGAAESYSPDGYDNEEWWGIMRTRQNASGPDTMEMRAVYYTLQELWMPSANAAHISVSPSALAFGNVALGNVSTAQTVTISNTGIENLDISPLTLSGANASEFRILNDYCSGHTLIPSKSCSLKVAFSPASAGSKIAALSIASDDPQTPLLNVALSGSANVSISGTVTSVQGPLAGVTMTLTGAASATTTTDASGNYIFTGLTNGNYTVTPGKAGCSFTPANNSLNLSGGNVTSINFTGVMRYSISGTTTSAQGPMSGVTMTLAGAASATTATDVSGNYTFNGLINGSYTVTPVKAGYTFTPASSSVSINGANIAAGNFSAAVTAFTVTPSAGSGGSISPSSPQTVNYNSTISFTATPTVGYYLASVSGCGATYSGNIITTAPVTANCTVSAVFAINTYTINPSAGSNGTISPSTLQTVSYNGTSSFTITPNTGYHIANVLVDGVSKGHRIFVYIHQCINESYYLSVFRNQHI